MFEELDLKRGGRQRVHEQTIALAGRQANRVALAFSHLQIMSARLVVLAEADPEFSKSAVAKQPIVEGISLLRDCVADLEQGILDANEIEIKKSVRQGPRPPEGPRPQLYTTEISYSNASGTSSFFVRLGPVKDEPPDTRSAVKAAEAARVKG